MSLQVQIKRMIIAHAIVTIGLLMCAIYGVRLPYMDYVSFVITSSQFSLLSIWLAFGKGLTSRRYTVGIAAAVLIVFIRAVVAYFSPSVFGPASLAAVVSLACEIGFNRVGRMLLVCLALVALKRTVFCIGETADCAAELESRQFQFHLRHLLAMMFLVAVALSAGKQIHGFFGEYADAVRRNMFFYSLHHLLFLLVGLIYSITIVLLSLFATLGTDRPDLAVVGALLGVCLVSPIWPLLSHQPAEGFAIQALVTFCQTLIVMMSLLVVRLAGYRLLRVNSARANLDNGEHSEIA